MESVMDFLAANYIYFFIAAGVLCFALIGFIFDSKKKKNNEFKGEDVVSTPTASEPVVNEPVQSENVSFENTVTTAEPVEMVEGPKYEEPASLENTMEINDIPMNAPVEEPNFVETPVNPVLEDNSKMSFGENISVDSNTNNEMPNYNEMPSVEPTTTVTENNTESNNINPFDNLN